MIFGFLIYLLAVAPWSVVSSTLCAGPGCTVCGPGQGQVGFFTESSVPRVAASVSVHRTYEVAVCGMSLMRRIYCLSCKLKTLYLTLFNTFR